MMKHSIKRQMITVFIGLLASMVLLLLIINVSFLEPYYISNKETQFIDMYEKLSQCMDKGTMEDKEVSVKMIHLAEKNNISFLIVNDATGKGYTNVYDSDMLVNQLRGYSLNQAQKGSKILESTKEYQISQSFDPWNQTDYIEMWGSFDDGSRFLLRSPLESIKESAAVSNRFLIYIGSLLILVAVILVWYFSKRLTDPILELAVLSEKMADLDFDAKYASGGSNEIGELGANFNRMSEKLESTISELKKANNRLLEDIEQKDKVEKMRNEFLGNVSHELKTPIALIQGYAEGLKEGVNEDAAGREFYCDVIMDEAAKMNQMVKNLLTLNQLEFGNDVVTMERFEITALVKNYIQSAAILTKQNDITVRMEEYPPIYAWADEFKIEEVFMNFFSNAVNHCEGEKIIDVKMEQKDGRVRVSVFNTGKPIPEDSIGHIWEKFYKVDKARTREYGGSGVGLSIVKAIMDSMNQPYGVINYTNGVEFWFELETK